MNPFKTKEQKALEQAKADMLDQLKATGVIAGTGIVSSGVGGAPTLYTLHSKKPLNDTENKLLTAIKNHIKKKNVVGVGENPALTGLQEKLMGPHTFKPYNSNKPFITPDSFKHPAIAAHEYGHAIGNVMKKPAMYAISKMLSSAAPTTAMLIAPKNETVAQVASVAAPILGLPMLKEEIGASYRGSKVLENLAKRNRLKLSRLSKLKPFMGVPSYIALLAAPSLGYGALKSTGFYDKPEAAEKIKRWFKKLV